MAADPGDWVPTTTGSVLPRIDVTSPAPRGRLRLAADRAIHRLAAPISTYTGSGGLTVKSYNDAVPPGDPRRPDRRGLVGAEASAVTISFDYGGAAPSA